MSLTHHPAQLIVGERNLTHSHVEQFLQKTFCARSQNDQDNSSGCFCSDCRKIKNHQHQGFVWICPEKDYTVDDIQIVFERARFALDTGQHFFFVLDNAQTLTTATANRMLKILEEPPHGYHFILLTTNLESIVPTIASRCLIIDFASSQIQGIAYDDHPIMAFFLGISPEIDPLAFEQVLKKQAFTDSQSLDLLQLMIGKLTHQLKTERDYNNREKIARKLDFLLNKMRKPPQSGSSELFWKHLFLSYPRC